MTLKARVVGGVSSIFAYSLRCGYLGIEFPNPFGPPLQLQVALLYLPSRRLQPVEEPHDVGVEDETDELLGDLAEQAGAELLLLGVVHGRGGAVRVQAGVVVVLVGLELLDEGAQLAVDGHALLR